MQYYLVFMWAKVLLKEILAVEKYIPDNMQKGTDKGRGNQK